MIEATEKDNRERYVDWLSQKVSPAQLSELYMSYQNKSIKAITSQDDRYRHNKNGSKNC